MRQLVALGALAFALLAGCTSTRMFGAVHYTAYMELDREAVAEEDVVVFDVGEKPERSFEEVGVLSYMCGGSCRQWLRIYPRPFVQAASRMGADAIILQEPTKSQQVDQMGGYSTTQYRAVVIVFRGG
jgi:hypothetical protein